MLTDEASGLWTVETPNLSMVLRQDEAGDVVLASLRTAEHEWVATSAASGHWQARGLLRQIDEERTPVLK